MTTTACGLPCVNNRAASNRRASNAAMCRCPRRGVVMPQHGTVLDEIHTLFHKTPLVGAKSARDTAPCTATE
jgi:hypothetical protein